MSLLAEIVDIAVDEHQVRLSEEEATAALARVMGRPALEARARLRFGPGRTCEQLARVLDKALVRAEEAGLPLKTLIIAEGAATAAEEIVRIRRKAHGVADWISSPTSDICVVLRPKGHVSTGSRLLSRPAAAAPVRVPAAVAPGENSIAALAVRDALYDVIDPDLGVNVVDLGFVRGIDVDAEGVAHIRMTLTSQACPLALVMQRNIQRVLEESETAFTLEWEWAPTWRPEDITPDGQEQLRAIGFSNFGERGAAALLHGSDRRESTMGPVIETGSRSRAMSA